MNATLYLHSSLRPRVTQPVRKAVRRAGQRVAASPSAPSMVGRCSIPIRARHARREPRGTHIRAARRVAA